MDKKRATNRDVAKLAGVSVATVSYVINGRADVTITEATKKKVLQAANFLNYSPNPFAASMKSNVRGIVMRSSAAPCFLRDLESMYLLGSLNALLRQNNYAICYQPEKTPEKLFFEACICFDMSNEDFHALGNENFVPLIAVDCLINDPVFYQVVPDYEKVKAAADAHFGSPYTYVAITPANEALRQNIISVFPSALFVSDLIDLQTLDIKHKNLLLTQAALNKLLAHCDNVYFYDSHLINRPQVILDCIKNAVGRIDMKDEAHYIKV
jgi:transcriptional regulator with XRE-family HTH domain